MGKFAKRRNHMQYIRITSENIDSDPDVLEYFIFSFTADFGEIIKDYIAEAQ